MIITFKFSNTLGYKGLKPLMAPKPMFGKKMTK